MQNSATINSTVTQGGTINSTVVVGSTIISTITGGGIGPQGIQGMIGPQGPQGPVGPAGSFPYFNVQTFGAVGDGIHDDTLAIQNAANAAASGGTLFFPIGIYKKTAVTTLYAGVSLLGVGPTASVVTSPNSEDAAFKLVGAGLVNGSLSIEQLGINGYGGGSADGILLEGVPIVYISMRDVAIAAFGGTGVHAVGPIVSTFERVTSTSNGLHGFMLDGGTTFMTSVSMINCYGNDNGGAGYYFKQATYCSLEGCASDSNGIGYYLYDVQSFSADGSGTESDLDHGVSGFPGDGWVIDGSITYQSAAIVLTGCFVYDVHGIAYRLSNYTAAVTFIGCRDSTPHSGAGVSLKTDSGTSLTIANCIFVNGTDITGELVDLADPNNALQATYNGVVMKNMTVTDTPFSLATSGSSLVMTNSSGSNFIESVGANNTGGGDLVVGTQFIGVEFFNANHTTGLVTFPNGIALGAGTTGSGNFVLASGAVIATPTINTNMVLSGTSGTLEFSAAVDGGDYNIFIATGTKTLALYGSASAVLHLNLLDGNLYMNTVEVLSNAGVLTSPLTALGAITGSPSSTTYLRGDGTWGTPSGSGMTNPMTTTGDMIYSSSGSTPARLAVGGSTAVLMGGTTPAWTTTPAFGVVTVSTINKVTITQPAASATLTIANTGSLITSGAFSITLTATGTTSVTLPTSGTLATVSGALGTPTSVTLTNGTGLPIAGMTGLGTGVATLLAAAASGTVSLAGTTSPTFITPTLGAASATSINKVTITAPGTSATLTLITGSSLITAGAFALTLTSSATTNATFPAGTNTLAALGLAQTFSATQTGTLWVQTPQAITVTTNAGTADVNHAIQTFTNSSAATMAITLTTASAVDGQTKIVRIYDFSAVAETIGWTNTENSTVAAPTTSNGSTTLPLTVGFIFNGSTSKWRCVAVA